MAQDIECLACSYKCGVCENQATECKTCSSDKRVDAPKCDCTPGYYDDKNTGGNGDCKKCKFDCECVTFEYCSKCF